MQKRKLTLQLLLVAVIIWAVWLPLAASSNFRMDSERMIFHADEALSQYMSEGRFGLVALLHVFGLTTWDPVLSGTLFLIFFTLAAGILCFFIHRFSDNAAFPYALFALIYATSPVWAFHIYFVLQIAAVGFGLMLTALLAGLDTSRYVRRRGCSFSCILFDVLSALLLTFSLSIYQGLIVHYLAAAAIFLFCHLHREKESDIRGLIPWALRVLISLALYLLVSRLIQGGESAYLSQQIQWGRIPPLQCLINIILQFGKMVLLVHSGSVSLYPLALLLFAMMMLHRWKASPNERRQTVLLGICGAAILLLPMAMSVLQGSRPVPRTQFALQVAGAFLPACYIAHARNRQPFLRILCVLAICLQVTLNVRLIHTDNLRNQYDTQAVQTIAADLSDTQVGTKPLIFHGALSFQDETILMEKTDVFGLSFFEWVYDPAAPDSATVSALRLLRAHSRENYTTSKDPALIRQASAMAENLPCFPQEGYVLETGDFILIKLSD